MTHCAGQVPANGGVSQQLQANLALPLPAVLDILVAAKAVFAGAMKGSHIVRASGTTVRPDLSRPTANSPLQHLLPTAHFEQVAGEVHLVQVVMDPAQSLADQQLHWRTHCGVRGVRGQKGTTGRLLPDVCNRCSPSQVKVTGCCDSEISMETLTEEPASPVMSRWLMTGLRT